MFSRREPQLRTVFKASAAIPKQIRMIQIQMTEKISREAGQQFDLNCPPRPACPVGRPALVRSALRSGPGDYRTGVEFPTCRDYSSGVTNSDQDSAYSAGSACPVERTFAFYSTGVRDRGRGFALFAPRAKRAVNVQLKGAGERPSLSWPVRIIT